MAHQRHPGARVEQSFDGRKRGLDPAVVGDGAPVVLRDVEIDAHEHPLALSVHVGDGFLVHSRRQYTAADLSVAYNGGMDFTDFTLTPLADYACNTGEGPLYHPDENRVYWTDIPNKKLFRYDLATGAHRPIEIGRQVGGFTLQADGSLLLFLDRGSIAVFREGEPLNYLISEIPDETETRFNDVFADPEGRVYCGTMPTQDRKGRLYRLDTDSSLTRILDNIGCSNGMGLTPDGKSLYYTDTSARTIYRFAYDRASGELTDRAVFAVSEDGGGYPDGMTVDADGFVWSARWDGGCLVRYSPGGEEVARVTFPARKVSCATFGGEDYSTMFVTTAGGHIKDTDGALAGSLFSLTIPGVRGVPEFRSKIRL